MRRRIAVSVFALTFGAIVGHLALAAHWPLWLGLLVSMAATLVAACRPHWFVLPNLRTLMFDHAVRELCRTTPPGAPVTEAVIALARYHFGVPVPDGEAVRDER